MPSADVDFAGTSYFGGKDDQIILCAGKSKFVWTSISITIDILNAPLPDGHIHIWDRESATLLHDLRAPDGDLTGIAWNTVSDSPMFATGSHNGAVKIWTSTLQQPLVNDSRSVSRTPSVIPSRAASPARYVDSPKEISPTLSDLPFQEGNMNGRDREAERTSGTLSPKLIRQ